MKYAVMMYGNEDAWNALPPAAAEALIKEVFAWIDRWTAEGRYIQGGARLSPAAQGRSIQLSAAGHPTVTDGPYMEAKEVLGGFIYLEADDIDEAVAIAATWPSFVKLGGGLEVRQVDTS